AGIAARRPLRRELHGRAARFREARRGMPRGRSPLGEAGRARRRDQEDDRRQEAGDLRLRGRSQRELLPDDPIRPRPQRDAAGGRRRERRRRDHRRRQGDGLSMLPWLADLFAPVAIQFDLAAAAVALVALLFSIVSFYRQRRVRLGAVALHAENDLLGWLNATIETLVSVEFLLRDWSRNPQLMQGGQFGPSRDEHLEGISIAIDKGRMYFPKFPLDRIGDEAPSPDAPR